jgi:hypothetical protein
MMTIVRRHGPRGRFDGSAQLWDMTATRIASRLFLGAWEE